MLFYGIMVLLAGIGLLAGALSIAILLHRRYRVPYALLTVGVITYTASLLAQVVLLRLAGDTLLGIPPLGALALGLAAGFTEETARLFGYQVLARGAATKPQALMIGAGHGFTEAIYTGIVALGLGLSLVGYGSKRPDDPGGLAGGALAEALNGLLPVLMHMALSWMVLQVFLRGEIYWLFAAIFFHTTAEMTAAMIGPEAAWALVVWRAAMAAISAGIVARLRHPT
jgi:uncharacterized membrane protein YhfC